MGFDIAFEGLFFDQHLQLISQKRKNKTELTVSDFSKCILKNDERVSKFIFTGGDCHNFAAGVKVTTNKNNVFF